MIPTGNRYSGDKAFVCRECGKRFSQRRQLTNHQVAYRRVPTYCHKLILDNDGILRREWSSTALFVVKPGGHGFGPGERA